jgi:hypothetical protein
VWKNILKRHVKELRNPFLVSGRRKDNNQRCPTPKKIKYPTKVAAIEASKEHRGRDMRAYLCPTKQHWHLTSEEFDKYGEKLLLKANFNFDKIKFTLRYNKWVGKLKLKDNLMLSIIAGEGTYSIPRKKLDNPLDYDAYEIAFMDNDGEWITNEVTDYKDDDVIGFLSKDEVIDYINQALKSNTTNTLWDKFNYGSE